MLHVFDDLRKPRKPYVKWSLRWGKTGADLDKLMQDYDRLSEEFPVKLVGFTYEADIRAILNGFKFDESMWQMKIEELSGGQNTRLALAKMLLEKPNLWYWTSRPTTWILRPLPGWKINLWSIIAGALLIVSHDRYFERWVCNHYTGLDQAFFGPLCR